MIRAQEEPRNWNNLPTEVIAHIAGFLDLESALTVSRFGARESWAVNQFSRNDVIVHLVYRHPREIVITLRSAEQSYLPLLTWTLSVWRRSRCNITLVDVYHQELKDYRKNMNFKDAAFRLLGKIFEAPMFQVKVLKLYLERYRGNTAFGTRVADLDDLFIYESKVSHLSTVAANFERLPKRLFLCHSIGYSLDNLNSIQPSLWSFQEVYIGMEQFLRPTNDIYRGDLRFRNRNGGLTGVGLQRLIDFMAPFGARSTRDNLTMVLIARPLITVPLNEQYIIRRNEAVTVKFRHNETILYLGLEE